MAGVMCGIFSSAASVAVLASTTPSDLPTCACVPVTSATTTAHAAARVMSACFQFMGDDSCVMTDDPAASRPLRDLMLTPPQCRMAERVDQTQKR